MIGDIMAYLNNYFEDGYIDGDFTISASGTLSPADGVQNHQYIAITGSTFNDGVYEVYSGTISSQAAETFNGRVWTLHPPARFLQLCERIAEYNEAHPASPYTSESFGGYTYSKATGANGAATWADVFAAELMPYRRMYSEVRAC